MKSSYKVVESELFGSTVRVGRDLSGEKVIVARDLVAACHIGSVDNYMIKHWKWAKTISLRSCGRWVHVKVIRLSELEEACKPLHASAAAGVLRWAKHVVESLEICELDMSQLSDDTAKSVTPRCGIVELKTPTPPTTGDDARGGASLLPSFINEPVGVPVPHVLIEDGMAVSTGDEGALLYAADEPVSEPVLQAMPEDALVPARKVVNIADYFKIREERVGGEEIDTVNARDLHEALESKQEFANWIKRRIAQCQLTENVDYVCLTDLSSKGRGGHNKIEYHLTIEAAKHVAMMEGNERGKAVRQYFIDFEKEMKRVLKEKAGSFGWLSAEIEKAVTIGIEKGAEYVLMTINTPPIREVRHSISKSDHERLFSMHLRSKCNDEIRRYVHRLCSKPSKEDYSTIYTCFYGRLANATGVDIEGLKRNRKCETMDVIQEEGLMEALLAIVRKAHDAWDMKMGEINV